MTDQRPDRCEACRFWCGADTGTAGKCRRYPPRPMIGASDEFYTLWPETAPDDWCGEFQFLPVARAPLLSPPVQE